MEAGSDTTSASILDFILAMIAHPDILKKAQQEVDSVCSGPPRYEDVKKNAYLNALMQEVCFSIAEGQNLGILTDIDVEMAACGPW